MKSPFDSRAGFHEARASRRANEAGAEVHDKACPVEKHAMRYQWRGERMIRLDKIGDYGFRL